MVAEGNEGRRKLQSPYGLLPFPPSATPPLVTGIFMRIPIRKFRRKLFEGDLRWPISSGFSKKRKRVKARVNVGLYYVGKGFILPIERPGGAR